MPLNTWDEKTAPATDAPGLRGTEALLNTLVPTLQENSVARGGDVQDGLGVHRAGSSVSMWDSG